MIGVTVRDIYRAQRHTQSATRNEKQICLMTASHPNEHTGYGCMDDVIYTKTYPGIYVASSVLQAPLATTLLTTLFLVSGSRAASGLYSIERDYGDGRQDGTLSCNKVPY